MVTIERTPEGWLVRHDEKEWVRVYWHDAEALAHRLMKEVPRKPTRRST